MPSSSDHLETLNREYEAVHTAKEDAFWASMMGLGDGPAARELRQETEVAWHRFLQDPARLEATEKALAEAEAAGADADTLAGLRGWSTTLQAHGLASPDARSLSEQIIAAEAELSSARGSMKLGYEGPEGFVESNSIALSVMIKNNPDEALRKAALYGMRSIEDHVLANGFLELVKQRNALARLHGFDSYYAWKVERTEQLTITQIFDLLDDLERKTREPAQRFIKEFEETHGAEATQPWNIHFHSVGDVVAEQDAYFSFADSVDRWGRSFAAMGIQYRGADLVLDLVQRRGKYENGFMHGPEVAWNDGGFKPARIHFTSNAIPGMVGSGQRATRTLFHEGGHAAHFSNIDMPAPCFGQEFAPTSAAFCETQSMFLDSLLRDADWLVRYAQDADGQSMPLPLIEKGIRLSQPIAAWEKRAWLSICYSERAIYDIPDDELTAERVLSTLRDIEKRMLFLDEGSVRPVLSVPHLLAGESSAYYHAYVLAEMAVQQTRRFFLDRDGHLVDNPRIGPELTTAYWTPGNSRPFFDYVEALTGNALSADALADQVSRTADEAVAAAQEAVAREPDLPRFEGVVELDARITIAHGDEIVATLDEGGWDSFADQFRGWIRTIGTAALALAALGLLVPNAAEAQGQYNVAAAATYDFVVLDGSAVVAGTPLTLTDSDAVNVTLPFPFTYYGVTYSDVRVGMNGAISFDTTTDIPDQNLEPYDTDTANVVDVGVYWDDLLAGSGGGVYTYDDSVANGRFIISWEDVERAGATTTSTGSFQVQLYDDSRIQVHFADTDFGDPLLNFGLSATTCVQNQTGATADWVYYGFDSMYVVDGTAVQFDECADADGDGDLDAACGGGDCDDTDSSINSGTAEFCNGIDDNCDGVVPPDETDGDGDGVTPCNGDCDDADATVSPQVPEVCDGLDNNCAGSATFGGLLEEDVDGDGYWNCEDCDDTDAAFGPGQPEICDGIDNDCDGTATDESSDEDSDGFSVCDGDCDDADDTVNPDANEICDSLDNDCDPATDEDVDDDGDGLTDCEGDCDDSTTDTQPGATEICDGEDNDCDEVVPTDELDEDEDNQFPCEGDCDDDDPLSFTGANEICDGIDNDCDGSIAGELEDADGDGQTPCEGDCDDKRDDVFEGAPEVCDGADNNCDGNFGPAEADEDGDGYLACIDDCNDTNPTINPDATEIC
ncbi:MAG: hypothetical protein KDA24_12875 [Deltaproteobacteria bacterium]|nr:hypothetical protein [Deltaproteobacteria bacterium]